MQLLIPFSDITEQGSRFDLSNLSWFPEELLDGAGPVFAEIRLAKKQENIIEMKGTLRSDIRLHCDRCLQEYKYTITAFFGFLLELVEAKYHWRILDLECDSSDLDIIQVQEPVVDMGDVLRQQVFLSMPTRKLCDSSCKGLCRRCGANLNKELCGCKTNKTESPFAVLATLKKR